MRRVLEKARRALLTDPVTGAPLDAVEIVSLVYGLIVTVVVIVEMIILGLGMGPGQ